MATKHRIATCVAPRLVTEAVTLAVNLDNKAPLKAGEISSDLANRKLTPESQAVRPLSKLLPRKNLG